MTKPNAMKSWGFWTSMSWLPLALGSAACGQAKSGGGLDPTNLDSGVFLDAGALVLADSGAVIDSGALVQSDTGSPLDASTREDATTMLSDAGGGLDASVEPGPNLLTTGAIGWPSHIGSRLTNTDIQFRVCTRHFPAGSAARNEVEAALAAYNAIEGTSVHFTLVETPHVSEAEMYEHGASCDAPRFYFDYVDAPFPCHGPASYDDCGDWAMNTCSVKERSGDWSGAGPRCYFNVGINPACKRHDTDPSADDYPRAANIMHELGHGIGMIHSPDWPAEDRPLVSVMQGNNAVISAYDQAFVRRFYGPDMLTSASRLVPSQVARWTDGSGRVHRQWFDPAFVGGSRDLNPRSVYIEDGQLKDCATDAEAVFAVTWFNVGQPTADGYGEGFVHALEISVEGERLPLVQFAASDMPSESQDTWVGPVGLPAAASSARLNRRFPLFFVLNEGGELGPRDDVAANELESTLFVASTASRCPGR